MKNKNRTTLEDLNTYHNQILLWVTLFKDNRPPLVEYTKLIRGTDEEILKHTEEAESCVKLMQELIDKNKDKIVYDSDEEELHYFRVLHTNYPATIKNDNLKALYDELPKEKPVYNVYKSKGETDIFVHLFKDGRTPIAYSTRNDNEFWVENVRKFLRKNRAFIGYDSEHSDCYYSIKMNSDWEFEEEYNAIQTLCNSIPRKQS